MIGDELGRSAGGRRHRRSWRATCYSSPRAADRAVNRTPVPVAETTVARSSPSTTPRRSRPCAAATTAGSSSIERTAGAQLHVRGNEITIEGDEAASSRRKRARAALRLRAGAASALGSDDVVRAVKAAAGRRQRRRRSRTCSPTPILTPRAGRPIAPKGLAQKQYVDAVRAQRHRVRDRPGRHRQDLPRDGAGGARAARQADQAHHPDPARGRGRREARLPARHARGEGQPVPAPALRRAPRHAGRRAARAAAWRTASIEVAPLAFMRGRTLNDSFVILDEAQNTTPEQMKMFLTRLGLRLARRWSPATSRRPTCRAAARSGLREALELVEGIRGIGIVHFTEADVVRHPLVAAIIRAYDARDRARVRSDAPRGRRARGAAAQPHRDTRRRGQSRRAMVVAQPRRPGQRGRARPCAWRRIACAVRATAGSSSRSSRSARREARCMLVLAWPERVARRRAARSRTWCRARRGNYGSSWSAPTSELEAARLDSSAARRRPDRDRRADRRAAAAAGPAQARADAIAQRMRRPTLELELERSATRTTC